MKNFIKSIGMAIAFICIVPLLSFSQDIYSAIEEGDVATVKAILQQDPSVLNLKNLNELTPLNLAAESNQPEVVKLLLDLGADPNIGDRENSQPIHLAAVNGSIAVADLLLLHGVNINARDDNGMTPLLFAASRGQYEMATHLIAKGADVKARSTPGFTTLQMAAISGNLEMVRMFIAKGVPVNGKSEAGFTALHSAASYGRTDVVKFLVENGADIKAETDQGDQPLAYAVGRNSYDAANYLIEKGAEVDHKNIHGMTALHMVVGRGIVPIAKLFVDNGADVNAATTDGWVPLTYTAWAENPDEMTRMLILSGADVNPDPCRNNKSCTCGPNFFTPLHAACEMGRTEMARILIENGAKVNTLDQEGTPPLHAAVKKGNIDIVKCLVEHGAFLNVKDNQQGATELHLAAELGYGDIAQYLMDHGSCFRMTDTEGNTPMDYAFYHGQNRIAYMMLAAGADDRSVSERFSEPCLLTKTMNNGEAEVWFLGHSGWAIKTQNHLLVFDYFDNPRSRKPDHACLASGNIDPEELKDQHVTVFCTHEHMDHYSKSIFDWNDVNPDLNYVLCFKPADVSEEYVNIPVHGETVVDGMNVSVIKSTDLGGGYLVEVDGLVIFHMGDHANGDDALAPEFTQEIDQVAAKNLDIDLLFGPIRGCSLGTPEQVKKGTYYALEKLHPALFIPMHSGEFSYEYKLFAEQAQQDGIVTPMKYAVTKGDRFFYGVGEEMTSTDNP